MKKNNNNKYVYIYVMGVYSKIIYINKKKSKKNY